jgi:SAM-dependent methyltransferase
VSEPYLEGATRAAFDAWQVRALARCSPPLRFSELRRGVQALSSLYVERRAEGDLAARALEGAAKRAAFACFYAPLHFLTLHRALAETPLAPARRVVDLGCGTAAAGAAAALRGPGARPRVLALDRSGFALGEARHTLAAFGLRAQLRRGTLPRALTPLGAGDLAVLAWCANELEPAARDALLAQLEAAAQRGAALLVVEPLATAAAPWWRHWVRAFAACGGDAREARARLALPPFLARLDRAAGLDHGELGARLLYVPGHAGAPRRDAVRRGARAPRGGPHARAGAPRERVAAPQRGSAPRRGRGAPRDVRGSDRQAHRARPGG